MANQNDGKAATTSAMRPGGAFDPFVIGGSLANVFHNLFTPGADATKETTARETEAQRGDGRRNTSAGQSKVVAEEGTFEATVDTKRMAEVMGLDEQLIIDDLNMTPLEKEQSPYTKTDLSRKRTVKKGESGRRLDNPLGGTAEVAGCRIFREEGKVRVESDYLGDFEYDPDQFALGYKELDDGSQLPVLEYVGNGDGAGSNLEAFGATLYMDGSDIAIPEGLKSMDYMFAGNTDLKYAPPIPSSITSMHYAFAGCSNLKYSVTPMREYNVPWSADLIPEVKDAVLGHTVVLPDGLEDMSGAFKDCGQFTSGFCAASDVTTDGSLPIGDVDDPLIDIPLNGLMTTRPNRGLPSSVLNIQDAFSGCESLDNGSLLVKAQEWRYGCGEMYSDFPKYGEDITPYLTSEFAKNALNKITSEDAKSYADSVRFVVGDDGMIDPETYEKAKAAGIVFDEDLLDRSRAATREEFLHDIHDGKVDNDAEMASGGQRSNNFYYDAAEDSIKDDVTGLMVSDDKPGLESWLQRLAIDGAAGLGIAGIVKKTTGSGLFGTVAGVAGAAALDHFDVIPESLSPIVCWTRDLLPEGKLKDLVGDFADKLSGSNVQEQLDNLTAENVAATYQNRRLQRSIWGIKGAYELADVEKSMYNNAEYCGANMNFKATADAAMKAGEAQATAGAREVVAVSLASMEEMWSKSGNPEGMKDYYLTLMSALESYNKGALDGIAKLANEDYRATSKQGLTMLNRAYVDEVIESLEKMDAKYHFMDDAAWEKMAGMSISGVDIANIRDYDKARIQELSDMSVAQVKSVVANAGENYVVGVIQENKADGSSFYNEGKGQFYNEGVPVDQTSQEGAGVADPAAQEAAATKDVSAAKTPSAGSERKYVKTKATVDEAAGGDRKEQEARTDTGTKRVSSPGSWGRGRGTEPELAQWSGTDGQDDAQYEA